MSKLKIILPMPARLDWRFMPASMVGNQGETHETMKETLAAAMRFKNRYGPVFPLIPYPGTGAHDWGKEQWLY